MHLVDNRFPRADELGLIADHLRRAGPECENVFVFFYLPGMSIDRTPYGLAHPNPSPAEGGVSLHTVPRNYYPLIHELSGIAPEPPTRFTSDERFADCLRTYSPLYTEQQFSPSSSMPTLHILPPVFQGDSVPRIRELQHMEIVYSAMSFFAHTNAEKLRIVAVPSMLLDFRTQQRELQKELAVSLTIDRRAALEIMHRYAGIHSFDELVGIYVGTPDECGYERDEPTEAFRSCLYNGPGDHLDAVYAELSK